MIDEIERTDNAATGSRQLAGRSLDLKVALLALAAFMIFMFLLTRWLFPEGVSLSEEGAGQSRDARDRAGQRELNYSTQGDAVGAVAEVVTIRRNVQLKGNDELAWSAANEGDALGNRDSLQTLRNSGATVKLDDDSLLQIGPDSLIVFQGNVPDPFTPARTNSIVMMSGTLDAQFASSQGSPRKLEVTLPNGLARFVAGDNDTTVAFNVNVNPDLSSSVSVHAGTGVLSVAGRTATVDAHHGITIGANGEILERHRLPGEPGDIRPRSGAVFEYRALPPDIAFRWRHMPGADGYRFRLSRDPEMEDVVIDERIASARFDYGGLGDGTYYWQINALTGFIEGPPSRSQQLRLVRDLAPPALRLGPAEVSDSSTVTVRGQTEAGASVYIQGNAVAQVDGRFEHRVAVDPGVSLIVVEAVDRAGNTAYDSLIINTHIAINGGGK